MTLKYTLIIEGSAQELKEANSIVHHVVRRHPDPYRNDTCILPIIEHKVVEPLRFEFTTTVDEMGRVLLTKGREQLICELMENNAGKKVKVVITEEE